MKSYEGCATCKFNDVNITQCQACRYELASKRDLIIRLLDDVNYASYEHNMMKDALLEEYNFDYAERYEGKTAKELLEQAINEAGEKNKTRDKIIEKLNCLPPEHFLDCNKQHDSELVIKAILNPNLSMYDVDRLGELLMGDKCYQKMTDLIMKAFISLHTTKPRTVKSFNNKGDNMFYDDYADSKMLNWANDGDDTQMKLDDMINMDNGKRISKVEYYLTIADAVSKRGTCLRRNYGSVIVKDDHIVSTGYNGAPRGRVNCCDLGTCYRQTHNIPSGERYEACRSTHSEMNAVINASPEEMHGATLYLVGHENDGSFTDADCCSLCKRVIINSGIEHVVLRQSNGSFKTVDVSEWIEHDDSLNV